MDDQRKDVKILLGIKDDSFDAEIDAALLDAEEFICRYCRVNEVPKGLRRVKAAMAAELYRERSIGKAEKSGCVKSIKEGDVGITFGERGNEIFGDFSESLNSYRRAGW